MLSTMKNARVIAQFICKYGEIEVSINDHKYKLDKRIVICKKYFLYDIPEFDWSIITYKELLRYLLRQKVGYLYRLILI